MMSHLLSRTVSESRNIIRPYNLPGNNPARGGSVMALSDIDNVRAFVQEKFKTLPRIEEKLESTNTKILYLVRKVNQLSKAQSVGGNNALTQERLMRVAEKLRDMGLTIEYTDSRGFLKLKALDQRGLDVLKRMSTVYSIEMIEGFLDNG
jgi:hypothetical protein